MDLPTKEESNTKTCPGLFSRWPPNQYRLPINQILSSRQTQLDSDWTQEKLSKESLKKPPEERKANFKTHTLFGDESRSVQSERTFFVTGIKCWLVNFRGALAPITSALSRTMRKRLC